MVDAQNDWNSSSISCGTAKYRVVFVVRWLMARGELSVKNGPLCHILRVTARNMASQYGSWLFLTERA
jgi:hypothetical protein